MNIENKKPKIFIFDWKDFWGFLKPFADYSIDTNIKDVSELDNYNMVIFHKDENEGINLFNIFTKVAYLDIPFLLFDYNQFRGIFDSWNAVSYPHYKKYSYVMNKEEILEQVVNLSK